MADTELHVPETMHIETPAPDPAPPEVTERPLSPREIAMAKIVERRGEALKSELDYGETLADDARELSGRQALEHPDRDGDGEGEGSKETSPSPEAKPAPVQAQAPAAAVEAPREHIVNVNGTQYRVTDEQMAHLANIGAIAIQAVQNEQQQPRQAPAAQPVPQQRQPAQPAAPQALLTREEARSFSQRMQFGSEDESAQALAQMAEVIATRARGAPGVDPNAIAQHVYRQVNQQALLERNLNQIGGEFPEIFNDTTRAQLAALKLHEVRQRDRMLGIQKTDLESYREACNEVRRAIGYVPPAPQPAPAAEPSQTQAASQPAPNEQRFERKRGAPRQLATAGRVASVEPSQSRPPTASEIVAQMKRDRGQLPLQ